MVENQELKYFDTGDVTLGGNYTTKKIVEISAKAQEGHIYFSGGLAYSLLSNMPYMMSKFTRCAPDDVSLSLERVKNEFGKTAYVPFETGLARTIEWQKELYRVFHNKQES